MGPSPLCVGATGGHIATFATGAAVKNREPHPLAGWGSCDLGTAPFLYTLPVNLQNAPAALSRGPRESAESQPAPAGRVARKLVGQASHAEAHLRSGREGALQDSGRNRDPRRMDALDADRPGFQQGSPLPEYAVRGCGADRFCDLDAGSQWRLMVRSGPSDRVRKMRAAGRMGVRVQDFIHFGVTVLDRRFR
jgi:hypothetical protein